MVCPANFSQQCCEFFIVAICFVEMLHSPDVGCGEAAEVGIAVLDVKGKIIGHGFPPAVL